MSKMTKKPKSHIDQVDEFLDKVGAKLCNCAECGTVLLSIESKLELHCNSEARSLQKHLPAGVAGKVNQRPYCTTCLQLWR